jgi:undecaprenyl-diphosphatase
VSDPEVRQAAELVAAHAIPLLGLGLLAALAAFGAVIAAVRLASGHRDTLAGGFAFVVELARRIAPLDAAFTQARAFVPSGYLALHLTLGLVLTVAATIFVVIAEDAVGGGELAAFDTALARALQDAASPGWRRFFAVVSWLGERGAIAVATAAIAVVFIRRHEGVVAAWWVAAQAGGGVLNLVLKQTYQRTRPEFADPMLAASSWSFPSGHAMGTFVLCGLGCYLLLREVRSWTVAGVLAVVLLSWCVVMGFSRLYLGQHYASDVVAGVIAGAAWVAVCASALEVARRRRPALP